MSQEPESLPLPHNPELINSTAKNGTEAIVPVEEVKTGQSSVKDDMKIMTKRAAVSSAREMFQRKIDESAKKRPATKKTKRPVSRMSVKAGSFVLQKQNLKKKTILRRLRSELMVLQNEMQKTNDCEESNITISKHGDKGLGVSAKITELTNIIQMVGQLFEEASKNGQLISQDVFLNQPIMEQSCETNKKIVKEIIDDIGLFTPEEQKQNIFLQPPGRNNSRKTSNVQSLVERYRSISGESNPSYADINNASVNISRERIQFLPEIDKSPQSTEKKTSSNNDGNKIERSHHNNVKRVANVIVVEERKSESSSPTLIPVISGPPPPPIHISQQNQNKNLQNECKIQKQKPKIHGNSVARVSRDETDDATSFDNSYNSEQRSSFLTVGSSFPREMSLSLSSDGSSMRGTSLTVVNKEGRQTSKSKVEWLMGGGDNKKPSLTKKRSLNNKPVALPPLSFCTVDAVVERITRPGVTDSSYKHVLFLTHAAYAETSDLLIILRNRFFEPDLSVYIEEQFENTEKQQCAYIKKQIQIKVVVAMKYWFQNFPEDFLSEKDSSLREKIVKQIEQINEKYSKQLIIAINKINHPRQLSSQCPEPKISTHVLQNGQISLMKHSTQEFARQLCLADFEVFREIKPRELIGQAWIKKKHLAANVVQMIRRFNLVCNWTQSCILEHQDISQRASCIGRILKVAEYLEKFNNLNSLAAINAGLNATPIYRLKKTIAKLSSSQKKTLEKYQELFSVSNNRTNLREKTLHLCQPGIPHLALFLSDLTFAEDGNIDEMDGLTNMKKFTILSKRIKWVQMFQQSTFAFKRLEEVHSKYFAKTMKIIPEEFFYNLSLLHEPRERN